MLENRSDLDRGIWSGLYRTSLKKMSCDTSFLKTKFRFTKNLAQTGLYGPTKIWACKA